MTFSDLTPQEENQLYSLDNYFENEDAKAFQVGGMKITPKLIAGALHSLPEDKRKAAATNMHQLTGDFYTVGKILGHTLKGIGISLGISTNLEAVTAQHVDVRLDRKKTVLETYHKALHPQKGPEMPAKPAKQNKKKSSEMEL